MAGSVGARFFDQQVLEDAATSPVEHHSHQPLLEDAVFEFRYRLALQQDLDDWTAAPHRDLLLRAGHQTADRRIHPGRKIPRAGLEVVFLDQLERDLARTRGADNNGIVSAIVEGE